MRRSTVLILAVLVLGASLLLVQVAMAVGMRTGAGPRENVKCPAMPMDQLTTALNLTPDQVSQIKALHESMRTQAMAIRNDASLTPEMKRDRLMALRKSTHDQIMSVLTPEQQTKLAQLREEKKERWFDRFSTALGLTPDQKAQVRTIKDQERADLMAVRNDTTLTPDAKVARIKEIRAAANAKIRALLTPEQIQKLDSFRGGHKGKMHRPGRTGAGMVK